MAYKPDHRGKEGYQDHAQDNQGKVVFNDRNIAKEVTRQRQAAYPREAAQCAEQHEQSVTHQAYAGNKGCKGANDGHESRKKDRLSTMFFIKDMGPFQVFTLEKFTLKALEQTHAYQATNPVVGVVAAEGSQHQQRHQPVQVQRI